MARHEKMYGDSPRLERDKDSGKVEAKKPSKAEAVSTGTDGMAVSVRQASERREMHHRHVKEHLDLHNRHQTEHAHGGEALPALHERHENEYREMHKRHHAELKALHDRHEKGEAEPEKKPAEKSGGKEESAVKAEK